VEGAALKAWRRAERERLIALRRSLAPAERRAFGRAIEAQLFSLLTELRPRFLGAYWPFRAEFDPRPLLARLTEEGVRIALPAVVDKKGPLEYRAWRPGESLIDGVWGIPTPEKREIVLPEAVLVPLVGFDRASYRLGYGGGYFDRTLAALAPRPLAIGIGFEILQIETIHPQPHDMPMDLVVTEKGVRRRGTA
jgi:5-formyltetrahydrofolate cyclo-ligase